MKKNTWFEVDKDGLGKLLGEREKHLAIFELVQNAWDTNAKKVAVELVPEPGSPTAHLQVMDDDPDGFVYLEHAYTLFAESLKKSDPTKRGRFNLGEKLVLALCKQAEVQSTKGTIIFNADGTRQHQRFTTPEGSIFRATIRMDRAELKHALEKLHCLIPPAGVRTIINGEELVPRKPIAQFEEQLPTMIANAEGILTRTRRKTLVSIYEARDGEEPSIYEMGIPVVATGDLYHVDIHQKVPLTMDRENVPPNYLKLIRAYVLNATAAKLDKDEASSTWVTSALSSEEVDAQAVTSILDKRFGEKRAVFDPSDLEANNRLVSEGYTVVPGRAFESAAWKNIRSANAIKPSGAISPTRKPYSDNPDDPAAQRIPRDEWTVGMLEVADLTEKLSHFLIDETVDVHMVLAGGQFNACFCKRPHGSEVHFNVDSLGRKWFNLIDNKVRILSLIIHELAHDVEANHLSDQFHRAISDMAGKLLVELERNPDFLTE